MELINANNTNMAEDSKLSVPNINKEGGGPCQVVDIEDKCVDDTAAA
jgi:hypothetical protein